MASRDPRESFGHMLAQRCRSRHMTGIRARPRFLQRDFDCLTWEHCEECLSGAVPLKGFYVGPAHICVPRPAAC